MNPNNPAYRLAIEQLAMAIYAQVEVPPDSKKPTWTELGTNLRTQFRMSAVVLLNEELTIK